MKILLIRFSSIGDIVLTTPVIRCLKQQTNAEIHYVTKASFAEVIQENPFISKVYTIQKRVGEVLPDLRRERYDYLIDLHHNLRSFLIKMNFPFVKSYAFKKLNFKKWLFVNFKINRLPQVHIVDRYLDTIAPLGVVNDYAGLDFFGAKRPQNINWSSPFIALVIGAGWNTKALTEEKLLTICQSIGYKTILLGGKREVEKGKHLEKATGSHVLNLAGRLSLSESAWVVKNAALVISGDTGLMHIAAAFRRRIISIWGSTAPEFGMYPYYPKGMDLNSSLEVKLPCRPCSKIGHERCPKGHFKCMEDLEINMLVKKAQQVLEIGEWQKDQRG